MTRDARAREDLKSTIDAIGTDAARLMRVEDQKLELEPDDVRMKKLSQEAVDLAHRLELAALEEQDLVEAETEADDAPRPRRN